MWHRWWNGAAWGGWVSLGGYIKSTPSCVSGLGRIECFGVSYNAQLHRKQSLGGIWLPWTSLGGGLTSAPECVARFPNRIDCFARSWDWALWNRRVAFPFPWGPWTSLGGTIKSLPKCNTSGENALECLGL